jgi:hypothetical protein
MSLGKRNSIKPALCPCYSSGHYNPNQSCSFHTRQDKPTNTATSETYVGGFLAAFLVLAVAYLAVSVFVIKEMPVDSPNAATYQQTAFVLSEK